MSTQVKRRRGSESEVANSTPANGELIVNTTDYTVHVGDGAKQGGHKGINEGTVGNYTVLKFASTAIMIADAPVGATCIVDGTHYKRDSDAAGTIADFTNLTEAEPKNVEQDGRLDSIETVNTDQDKTLQLNHNYLEQTNPTKTVVQGVVTPRSTQYKPKLVILLGQSNAEGRGTSADANANKDTTGNRPSVQIWFNNAFEDLHVPTTTADPDQNNDALAGRYGIELGLANYAEYNNETLYLVKVTEGGTYMGQWLANEDIIPVGGGDPNDPENDGDLDNAVPPGGFLDTDAWTKTQAAVVEMDTLFGVNGWEPVLVMLQGEANGTSPTQKPRFKRQRITFNDRWRTRFTSTLRIIYAHILAVDSEYIDVNGFMNEIDYEDQLTYVIENTEHLQSDDNLHLNYFGLCQMSKRVYDEIRSPTSKNIAYPSGRVDTIQAAGALNLNNYTDILIVEGTDSINYTNKDQCRDGRILTLWRKDTGAGVAIRHNQGDPNIYANFMFISGGTTSLVASTVRKFIGYEGHWYEVSFAP